MADYPSAFNFVRTFLSSHIYIAFKQRLKVCDKCGQPIHEIPNARDAAHIAVHNEPKTATDINFVRQKPTQIAIKITDKAGQNSDAGTMSHHTFSVLVSCQQIYSRANLSSGLIITIANMI